MAFEEIEILKKRAIRFLENGIELLEKNILDLAAFNFQQFSELYLKYRLAEISGEYPKTHSIKRLLKELATLKSKEKDVTDFLEKNIDRISNLENAYITSRYIPVEFERKEVENMKEMVEKLKDFVDSI
ncbi:DNA-binding protein [Archaeoglobales archaeon]|nr:MAG: DNA-binding protein [Archaeoglobales archaeon]